MSFNQALIRPKHRRILKNGARSTLHLPAPTVAVPFAASAQRPISRQMSFALPAVSGHQEGRWTSSTDKTESSLHDRHSARDHSAQLPTIPSR